MFCTGTKATSPPFTAWAGVRSPSPRAQRLRTPEKAAKAAKAPYTYDRRVFGRAPPVAFSQALHRFDGCIPGGRGLHT